MSRTLEKYRAKYQVTNTVKAFKRLQELSDLLGPVAQDELEVELAVLDFIEQAAYAYLTSQGVESLEQQYLIGYMKRLWVFALKFTGATYEANRELLTDEYITRGHALLEDPAFDAALWAIVDDAVTAKKARLVIDFQVFVGVMT